MNAGSISLKALQEMSKVGGNPFKFQSDSMSANGKDVDVRITFDPANATKNIKISGSTYSARAKETTAKFKKYFGGNVAVVSLDQQGDFGMVVDIAAKVDSTGFNTE